MCRILTVGADRGTGECLPGLSLRGPKRLYRSLQGIAHLVTLGRRVKGGQVVCDNGRYFPHAKIPNFHTPTAHVGVCRWRLRLLHSAPHTSTLQPPT